MNLSNVVHKNPVFSYDMVKRANNDPAGSVVWMMSEAIPLGYLLCDGAAVGRRQYPDLFAAIGTTYGEGDGVDTFNVPNLIGKFLEGSNSAGAEHEAGLPNITASTTYSEACGILYSNAVPSGAFTRGQFKSYSSAAGNTSNAGYDLDFDASLSNSIYGNSDTVQPPAVTALPCIKAYNNISVSNGLSVVEFLSSGDNSNWCKVYNNDWVECGGFVEGTSIQTLTFPYEFASRPCYYQTLDGSITGFTGVMGGLGFQPVVTTTTHRPFLDTNFRRTFWYACGFRKVI